jgi:mono/diheme cytochrome c family protein
MQLASRKITLFSALTVSLLAVVLFAQPTPKAPAPSNPAQQARDQALDKQFTSQVLPILNQYCFTCHGNGKKKGDLVLDRFTNLQSVRADKKVWSSVTDMLEQHSMPPDNKPQPTEDQYKTLLTWIDQATNQIDCTGPKDPGYVAIHRLNRNEYNNTIRDLVGVDFKPATDFPSDDTGYGFDNIADVLTMSPLLMEKYIAAADEIFDKAITDFTIPKTTIVKYAANTFNPGVGSPVDGSATAWNLGTNGQITRRHDFPAEGEYEIRIRAWQEPFGDQPAKMTIRFDNRETQTYDVTALIDKPATFKIRQKFTQGGHRLAIGYINNLVDRNNPDLKKRGDRNLIADRVEIEGPFNPKAPTASESHKRLFFIMPGTGVTDESAARQIITRFATRAFRRPVRADEMVRLMRL